MYIENEWVLLSQLEENLLYTDCIEVSWTLMRTGPFANNAEQFGSSDVK